MSHPKARRGSAARAPAGRRDAARPQRGSLTLLIACMACVAASVLIIPLPSIATDVASNAAVKPVDVREIRVLIGDQVHQVRFRSAQGLRLTDEKGRRLDPIAPHSWVTIERAGTGRVRLNGSEHAAVQWHVVAPAKTCEVAWFGERDWLDPLTYPGTFRILIGSESGFDVINELDLERYVSCVTAWEAWPTFHVEALRAQAVVARSFALFQMVRRHESPWDIAATQGAQVYRGLRADDVGRRAAQAAAHTSGIVCAWSEGDEDRLFSTYYSAACGGMSQSAAIFGAADGVPPLAGEVACDFCRIAPRETYRWGPVRMSARDALARIAARYSDARSLGRLDSVDVIERARHGRAVRIRLMGGGQSFEMLAEQFRLALGGSVVRSTWSDIRVVGDELVFEKGKGFGHGLGLCQWGMEGQAIAGRRAGEILRHYYPGSNLVRVY